MIGKMRVLRYQEDAAATGSAKSQPTCGCPRSKHEGARPDQRIDAALGQHGGDRRAGRGVLHAQPGRQVEADLLDPPRLLVAAAHPGDVGGRDTVLLLQDGARPHVRGQLVFRHADALALEIRGRADAVGADIDRGMAEGARGKDRHADIGAIALGRLDGEAAERQLADVEIGVAEGAEEDLLGLESHEDRLHAVDPDSAVDQRANPVIVADGD
jgi:hypothetical protein